MPSSSWNNLFGSPFEGFGSTAVLDQIYGMGALDDTNTFDNEMFGVYNPWGEALTGLEGPHQLELTVGLQFSTGSYHPLTLEALHHRLVWVENYVRDFQLQKEAGTKYKATQSQMSGSSHGMDATTATASAQRWHSDILPSPARRCSPTARVDPQIDRIIDQRRRGRGSQYRVVDTEGKAMWVSGKSMQRINQSMVSNWQRSKAARGSSFMKALTM
ncbi:hypothetical protein R3P38DRAFT_2796229 [Favolaschia claudopus]|uniref:Uncharacterized protein n=1 Tax=Favolaschia claudopus TaxID=2862362 RepID=A0AAW0A568_9AGAR